MSGFINTIDLLGDEIVCVSIVGRTITEFKDNVLTTIGKYAFHNCVELTAIDLPNVTTLDGWAFDGCGKLVSVNLPNVKTVNSRAFNVCSSLVSIYLPSTTSINSTDGGAFYTCSKLTTVDLPSLTSLNGTHTFNGCSALVSVILRSETMCTLGSTTTFNNTPIAKGTGYIYVPRALLSDTDSTMDYRRATNWATYANQFRALEDFTVDGTITGALDENKI